MLTWLVENIASIVICGGLIAVVASIIIGMIKNKRKGKSSCGCGCTGCPMEGNCHQNR